jgi:hypothetical protein
MDILEFVKTNSIKRPLVINIISYISPMNRLARQSCMKCVDNVCFGYVSIFIVYCFNGTLVYDVSDDRFDELQYINFSALYSTRVYPSMDADGRKETSFPGRYCRNKRFHRKFNAQSQKVRKEVDQASKGIELLL